MKKGAHVLLVTRDGKIVLQQRDNKPGITNPGMIAIFGGTLEKGENETKGAIREIEEELSLTLKPEQLIKLNVYYKSKEKDGEDYEVHIFYATKINLKDIKLREGKSIFLLNSDDNLEKLNLTRITKLAVEEYFAKNQ